MTEARTTSCDLYRGPQDGATYEFPTPPAALRFPSPSTPEEVDVYERRAIWGRVARYEWVRREPLIARPRRRT